MPLDGWTVEYGFRIRKQESTNRLERPRPTGSVTSRMLDHSLSAKRDMVASGSEDNAMRPLDVRLEDAAGRKENLGDKAITLLYSPGGKMVASGNLGSTV